MTHWHSNWDLLILYDLLFGFDTFFFWELSPSSQLCKNMEFAQFIRERNSLELLATTVSSSGWNGLFLKSFVQFYQENIYKDHA